MGHPTMICRDNLAKSTSLENYTAKKDEIFAFKNLEAETDLKWNSLVSLNRNGGSVGGSDGWKGREDKVWSDTVNGSECGRLSRNSFNGRGGNEHCF